MMVAQPTNPIDIDDMPALAHLVDEVARSRRPRAIQRDGETIAMLVPAAPRRRPASPRGPERLAPSPPRRYKDIEEMMADRGPPPERSFTWEEIKDALDQDRADAWRAKYG